MFFLCETRVRSASAQIFLCLVRRWPVPTSPWGVSLHNTEHFPPLPGPHVWLFSPGPARLSPARIPFEEILLSTDGPVQLVRRLPPFFRSTSFFWCGKSSKSLRKGVGSPAFSYSARWNFDSNPHGHSSFILFAFLSWRPQLPLQRVAAEQSSEMEEVRALSPPSMTTFLCYSEHE